MLLRLPKIVCFASLLLAAGCGDTYDGPPLYDAGGSVTYQGQPVEGGIVLFKPTGDADGRRPIQMTTDDQGRFELYSYPPGEREAYPGARAGEYVVTIYKMEKLGPEANRMPADLLPKRYRDAGDSGLSAVVTDDGPNDFRFELNDD